MAKLIITAKAANGSIEGPTPVTSLAYDSKTSSSVRLYWEESTAPAGTIYYRIHQDTLGINTVQSLEYRVNNLDPDTDYEFTVVAIALVEGIPYDSTAGNVITVRTLAEASAPTPPELDLGDVTSTTVELFWTGAEPPEGGAIADYRIFRVYPAEAQTTDVSVGVTANSTFIVENLDPSTPYAFAVKTNATSGNSSEYSNVIEVTTESEEFDTIPPPVPTNLVVTNLLHTSCTLSWGAVSDPSTPITYTVVIPGKVPIETQSTSLAITGLTSYTSYALQVKATDARGNASDLSEAASITTKPAPVNLKAGATTHNSVVLEWLSSVGVSHAPGTVTYKIYMALPGQSGELVTETQALTATIENLASNTYYVFTAIACANTNCSVSSGSISVLTTSTEDTTAPTIPTNLRTTSVTSQEIALAWDASTDIGGSGVKEYLIYVDDALYGTSIAAFTSKTIRNLDASRQYKLNVKAQDIAGNLSGLSEDKLVTTNPASGTLPGDVSNLRTGGIGETSIELIWNPAVGNPTIVGYNIYIGSTAGGVDSVMESIGVGTTYTVRNLTQDTLYYFRVKAKNNLGLLSPNYSNEVEQRTNTTEIDEAPSEVTGIRVDVANSDSLEIVWNPSSDDNSDTIIYTVYVDDEPLYPTTLETSYVITGLDAQTTYAIRVVATDDIGNSNLGINVCYGITTEYIDDKPPTKVIGLTAIPLNGGSVYLSWNPAYDESGIKKYLIFGSPEGTLESTTTTLLVRKLEPMGTYGFRVKAVDNFDNVSTEFSDTVAVTMPIDQLAPTRVSFVTVVPGSETDDSLGLEWGAAEDEVTEDLTYKVWMNGDLIHTTKDLTYTVTGLDPDSTYTFVVVAEDDAGNPSSNNTIITGTTLPYVDEFNPTNVLVLTKGTVSVSTFALSWTAASDDVGVVGYKIYNQNDEVVLDTMSTATSKIMSGLTPLSVYTYKIKAYDAAGNESLEFSNSVTGTTLEPVDVTPPETVTGLVAGDITFNSIKMSWNPVSDTDVAGYHIYNNAEVLVGTVLAPITTFTKTGLLSNNTYSFKVKAYDTSGLSSGDFSNVIYPNTIAETISAPTLQITNTTETTVTLNWTTVANAVGYEVYDGTGVSIKFNAVRPYQIIGLTAGNAYTYKIKAYSASGLYSAFSNSVTANTPAVLDTTPPTDVANLVSSDVTTNSVVLTWNAATDDEEVVGYNIYSRANEQEEYALHKVCNSTALTTTLINLEPHRSYHFVIKAFDLAGNESVNFSNDEYVLTLIPDVARPSNVLNLQTASVGTTRVVLFWDASIDDVTVNLVYRVMVDGAEWDTTQELNYTVEGLTPGNTYTFQVIAVDEDGYESAYNAIIERTTRLVADIALPDNVTGLYLEDFSSDYVLLVWAPALDNPDRDPVYAYRIYDGAGNYIKTAGADAQSYVGGLLLGQSYSFSVKAVDSSGNESAIFSNIVEYTSVYNNDPDAVQNLAVTAEGMNTITITFDELLLDETGISHYNIYNGANTKIGEAPGSPYVIPNLLANTEYTLKLRAETIYGKTSLLASNVVTAHTTEDTEVPSAVVVSVDSVTHDAITISWTEATDNSSTGLTYRVYVNDNPTGWAPQTERTFVLSGLTLDTQYSLKVKAFDATGNESVYSNTVYGTPEDNNPPSVVEGLSGFTMSSSEVRFSWYEVYDGETYTECSYHVYQDGVKIGETTNNFNYAVTGLSPSTPYSFTIKAVDSSGNQSEFSDPLVLTTHVYLDTEAPGIPVLSLGHYNNTKAELSWTIPIDNVAVTGYKIKSLLFGEVDITYGLNSTLIENLLPGTEYTFQVLAFDNMGNQSELSNEVTFTTYASPDITAPAMITGLAEVSPSAANFLDLIWNAAPEADLVSYTIIDQDDNIIAENIQNARFAQGVDLAQGADYEFRVIATDFSGNASTPSAPVAASLPFYMIPSVQVEVLPDSDPKQIRFFWNFRQDRAQLAGVASYEYTLEQNNVVTGPFTITDEFVVVDAPALFANPTKILVKYVGINGAKSLASQGTFQMYQASDSTPPPNTIALTAFAQFSGYVRIGIGGVNSWVYDFIGVNVYDENDTLVGFWSKPRLDGLNYFFEVTTPGITYNFKVKTLDYFGNESVNFSNMVTFTTT